MRSTVLAICFLILFSISSYAQTDSVIQHRVFNAELTATTDTLATGKPYVYFNVRMRKGDMAYLRYMSNDYVVALGIQDSFGRSTLKEDAPMFFKTTGSKISMPFECPEDGMYYFIFTSKERKATGKFKAALYYYTLLNNRLTDSSPLCEKLHYIADQSIIGFAFLKGTERKSILFSEYDAKMKLVPEADCYVSDPLNDIYTCSFPVSKDLAAMESQFAALDKMLKECLTGTVRKVYTIRDISEYGKERFVKKVDYSMPGTSDFDENSTHALLQIKYRVALELEKTDDGGYRMYLKVE
jgi:hypothetical protein